MLSQGCNAAASPGEGAAFCLSPSRAVTAKDQETESNGLQAFCCARRYRTKAILPSIFSFAYTWWR